MMGKAEQVAKVCILLILSISFGIQVQDGVSKFLGKRTTFSSMRKPATSAKLPIFSFCPGLKSRNLTKTDATYFDENPGKDVATADEIKAWWDSANYKEEEIFGELLYIFNSSGYRDPVITERSGLTGKCFSMEIPDKLVAKLGLLVTLKFANLMSNKKQIVLYVHEPHNSLGLNMNFWPEPVTTQVLPFETQGDLALTKEVIKHMPSSTMICNSDPNYSKGKCSLKWGQKKYFDAACPEVCFVPQAGILLEGIDVPMCTSRESSACMVDHLFFTVFYAPIFSSSVTGCQEPCTNTFYNSQFRVDPSQLNNQNSSYIFLVYDQTDTNIQEEILFYDFNAILAAVGGSLGLFLGFSCRGFLLSSLTKIARTKWGEHLEQKKDIKPFR